MQISMSEIFNMQRRAEIAEKGGEAARNWDRELVGRVSESVNQYNDEPGDETAHQAEVARLREEVIAFYVPPEQPEQPVENQEEE